MSLVTTPAILLRSFAYGETSRILRFYSRDLGLVGVMARGARTGGARGTGALETFTTGALTLYVKETRELQTLKEFHGERHRGRLAAPLLRFTGAAVLGELILRHAGEEGSPEIFERVEGALDHLEAAPPEGLPGAILAEGWGLVAALGFSPLLDVCVSCSTPLRDSGEVGRFDFGAGGVLCEACGREEGAGPLIGPGARDQLRDLLGRRVPPGLGRPRAHLRLLGDFITYHLSGGRPLDAFRLLDPLLPPDEE